MPISLHTTQHGPVDSPATVLWVHGVDSDSHVWDGAVELLKADLHCVGIDLPGHGLSPQPDDPAAYEREAVLSGIDSVIDDLRSNLGNRPVVLVGHSLGGYLGLAHALTRSSGSTLINGLVLVSAGPGFRDPAAMQSWNERVQANSSKYSVSEVAASIAFHVDSLVMDHITEVSVPVALVIGDGDRAFVGANDYLEKKLPHVQRTTVEGGRHFVMKTHPESVADSVRAIIAELGDE